MRVATIGYENATVDGVIDTLVAARVMTVVDVRALPLSRRPGFSKTALAAALRGRRIEYVHLRALGTPPAGREAARRQRHDEMRAIYRVALADPAATAAAAELTALAESGRIALLCYERDPAHCHRAILTTDVLPDATIEHLLPPER